MFSSIRTAFLRLRTLKFFHLTHFLHIQIAYTGRCFLSFDDIRHPINDQFTCLWNYVKFSRYKKVVLSIGLYKTFLSTALSSCLVLLTPCNIHRHFDYASKNEKKFKNTICHLIFPIKSTFLGMIRK